MARIVDIPKGTRLTSALTYFAQQLPTKEVGWLELFGRASDVTVSAGGNKRELSGSYEVVHCVCVVSVNGTTISGVLANDDGRALYSGPVADLVSNGITGRLTTLPKTPWQPAVTSNNTPAPTDMKATQEQTAADITWASLSAAGGMAPVRTETTTQAPKPPPVELKTGDILIHPRFGRCRVVRSPAFGKLKVRRPNGSFTDLHMKVIDITRVETVDEERLIHMQMKSTAKQDGRLDR